MGDGIAAVRITGLKEMTKALKALDDGAGKRVTLLNKESAAVVAVTARAFAPVGQPPHDKHPGLLASTVKAGATQRTGYVRAGSASAPYAAPIHWGWASRNIAPNEFMRRALGFDAPAIGELWRRGFRALIEEVGLET